MGRDTGNRKDRETSFLVSVSAADSSQSPALTQLTVALGPASSAVPTLPGAQGVLHRNPARNALLSFVNK